MKRNKHTSDAASLEILGMRVAITSLDEAVGRVMQLSEKNSGSYVCAANVHMCIEAYEDTSFRSTVNRAAMVVPDGKPLMWWLRSFGMHTAQQVRGPDLFISVSRAAKERGVPIGLYGGAPDTLEKLKEYLLHEFPGLIISCAISPPFRELSASEEQAYKYKLRQSGARILFVGLGCPKQEKWMERHRDDLNMVMLGVGAAFDFYSGKKSMAPIWMRKIGMEWFHRLLHDPKRLCKDT